MISIELVSLIPLGVLGAVLGLDAVSFPQAMLSRPIVASTLSGALIGQAGRGLVMGVALEFFALESMPFGASRYPEWGSASVVGGFLFAQAADGMAGAMTVAVLAALLTASAGGASMVLLRRANALGVRKQQAQSAQGSRNAVLALQLGGMTADLVRGGLLTFLALVVFVPLQRAVTATVTMAPTVSRAGVVAIASAVGLAAVWKVVHTTNGARWCLLGGLGVGFGIAASLQ